MVVIAASGMGIARKTLDRLDLLTLLLLGFTILAWVGVFRDAAERQGKTHWLLKLLASLVSIQFVVACLKWWGWI